MDTDTTSDNPADGGAGPDSRGLNITFRSTAGRQTTTTVDLHSLPGPAARVLIIDTDGQRTGSADMGYEPILIDPPPAPALGIPASRVVPPQPDLFRTTPTVAPTPSAAEREAVRGIAERLGLDRPER